MVEALRTAVTMEDRLKSYFGAGWYAGSLHWDGRWLSGTWMVGREYERVEGYYGEFPPRLLRRILDLFPEVHPADVLHLFSGTLSEGVTVDSNSKNRPTYVGDAEKLSSFLPAEYRPTLTVADPPYSPKDAERYGVALANKRLVVREVAQVTRPGGFLVWLDTSTPIYRNVDWEFLGPVGVWTGTNRVFRALSFFRRADPSVRPDSSTPSMEEVW